MQGNCWAKSKTPVSQRTMKGIQTAQSSSGKVVESPAVRRGTKRLAPVEQRLGIDTQGCAVEFSLAVEISPPQKAFGCGHRARVHTRKIFYNIRPGFANYDDPGSGPAPRMASSAPCTRRSAKPRRCRSGRRGVP